jgi:hypothetical protein
MNEVTGANRVNILNPGPDDLIQANGVVKVAGPSANVPFATELDKATAMTLALFNKVALDPGGPFSVAYWAKVALDTVNVSPFNLQTNNGSLALAQVFTSVMAGTIYLGVAQFDGNGNQVYASTHAGFPDAGAWHHYAITFDGIVLTFSIDGGKEVFYCTGLGTLPTGAMDLTIDPSGALQVLTICQCAYWFRCLSMGEIQYLYNGGLGISSLTA